MSEVVRSRPPGRRFLDRDGVGWTVYEIDSIDTSADRYVSCLLFLTSQEVRRVHQYPTNWRELSDDELAHLSERA